MAETAGFLKGLEDYYQLQYHKVQAAAIAHALEGAPRAYLMDLYREIINTHPVSLRSLPDVVVVNKARANLRGLSEYGPKRIEEPADRDEAARFVREINNHELTLKAAQAERERVRVRVMKGQASGFERWWLECMDQGEVGKAKYRPMPEIAQVSLAKSDLV